MTSAQFEELLRRAERDRPPGFTHMFVEWLRRTATEIEEQPEGE